MRRKNDRLLLRLQIALCALSCALAALAVFESRRATAANARAEKVSVKALSALSAFENAWNVMLKRMRGIGAYYGR